MDVVQITKEEPPSFFQVEISGFSQDQQPFSVQLRVNLKYPCPVSWFENHFRPFLVRNAREALSQLTLQELNQQTPHVGQIIQEISDDLMKAITRPQ